MSRADVLFAVNDFPPIGGGESRLYHGLARHLHPAAGVVMFAPSLPGAAAIDALLPTEVLRRPMPPHGGTLSRLARSAAAGAHLAALLARRRFRYLVCGQLLSLGGPMRTLAAAHGVPYAVFVHGADLLDYHARPPWGRLARFVIEGADAVIANSRFTAALVERLLPEAARRIVVLPMGVDPAPAVDPADVDSLRRRYRLGEGPVLLTVARLVAVKGHDVALDALPRIAERHPGVRYVIVGDGPERARLEAHAVLRGVTDRVVFTGRIPEEMRAAHYALGDVYLQLSRVTGTYDGLEGFGLSFLEAASFGLPSIGGDSGGVGEAIAEGVSGFLVPPLDRDRVVATTLRLLDDAALRRAMAGSARLWAARHPWARSAETLQSLWNGARAEAAGAEAPHALHHREAA
ncbi:MAG TPA: glycosyltransferase family 4 protein [Candidatus Polarisedimenticolia bacterium]|nr:glycosyltransferase family 4 protein [Candidatus Polarisedimenticolia bacterium]